MRQHPVTFVISSSVQIPGDPVPALRQFVSDMAFPFRETNRLLTLDENNPWKRGGLGNMVGSSFYPKESFGVTMIIGFSDRTGGGWTRVAPNGDAVVLFDTARIYEAGGPLNSDGQTQIWISQHELGHQFGLDLGEITDLFRIDDLTEVEPIVGVNADDLKDALWGRLSDYATDPMLHQGIVGAFSAHHLRIINGSYRIGQIQSMPPLAPLDQSAIVALGANDAPLAGVRVRIWSVNSHTSEATLLADTVTGPDGRAPFTWPDNPRSNDAVLWKAHAPEFSPVTGWLTIIDLEDAGMDGIPLTAYARLLPQKIVLEAVQDAPGMLRITGLQVGQEIDILSGPSADGVLTVVDRITATGTEMFWFDPSPASDSTKFYDVRLVRKPVAMPLTVEKLCRMCGQREVAS